MSSLTDPVPPAVHPLVDRRGRIAAIALLVTVPAFALAALSGPGLADAGLVPVVRFMGGIKLALAVLVAGLSVRRRARPGHRRRRTAGLVGAACMALGAGLIWSGTGFGAGFAAFASGSALASLLAIGELHASLRRRP